MARPKNWQTICFPYSVRGFVQFLAACLLSFVVVVAKATPPPNDNFADRIILTGTSITFTGTLDGATREANWEASGYPFVNGGDIPSVWWEWTASNSSAVTIQIIDPWSYGERPCPERIQIYYGSCD